MVLVKMYKRERERERERERKREREMLQWLYNFFCPHAVSRTELDMEREAGLNSFILIYLLQELSWYRTSG